MNQLDYRYFKRLVIEVSSTLIDWLDDQITAPQSPPEPRTTPRPAEPIAEPKRKRGRPRKIRPVEFEIAPHRVLEDTASHEQAPKTYNCSYCGRVLPHSVRELHEANCRSAAVGYATHVAQPGKGGSDLG